ncbi:MAG: hypothetical protein H0X66_20500 [Verrucomicrobia bacterium]|nr:hypothetical protein [Verrucomicrobiota bacterium]
MNLDDAQRKKVAAWIEEGAKLSDIQKKMETELGITMTYLDVRMLVDDLKLMPKDPVVVVPPQPEPAPTAEGVPAEAAGEEVGTPIAGNVSVTVDQVTRPGAMISGKVTFSDGNTGDWYLDQTGRLGVSPTVEGYRPSQEDVVTFQTELQSALAKLGL